MQLYSTCTYLVYQYIVIMYMYMHVYVYVLHVCMCPHRDMDREITTQKEQDLEIPSSIENQLNSQTGRICTMSLGH